MASLRWAFSSRTADSDPVARALAWVTATYHTAFFVLLPLALVHVFGDLGDLVGALNTFVGVGLYVTLWGLAWWTHRDAVAGASAALADRDARAWAPPNMGVVHGAAIGAGFTLVGGIALTVASGALLLLVFTAVAALFAAFFGAIVGFAFALLDSALYAWAVAAADRCTKRVGSPLVRGSDR